MSNRSLDDFAAGGTDEETAEDETLDEQAPSDDDGVETLATYRWTPTGTECPQCGESVEQTWLDGDEYVCSACKNW